MSPILNSKEDPRTTDKIKIKKNQIEISEDGHPRGIEFYPVHKSVLRNKKGFSFSM